MAERFQAKKALTVALAASLLIEAVSHPTESMRAVNTLLSRDQTCNKNNIDVSYYDTIAVFGAGTFVDNEGINHPNFYQAQRLRQAARLYVDGYSDHILLVDGGDPNAIYESYLLIQKYVDVISDGQKEIGIWQMNAIHNSVNSADNVRGLKEYAETHLYTRVLGVTNQFHQNRIRLLTQNYQVSADLIAAECDIDSGKSYDSTPISGTSQLTPTWKMKLKESIGIAELIFDPYGELTIRIKK